MKISVISSGSRKELAEVLEAHCRNDQVTLLDQSCERADLEAEAVADADVLILDCQTLERLDWAALESFNLKHPYSTTALICNADYERVLVQAMRVGVRDVLKHAEIAEQLPAVIERARIRLAASLGTRVAGKILTFIPCKGGSGTSFISSNLAYVLGEVHNRRVLLIDLDLQFADASFYITDDDSGRTLGDIVRRTDLDGSLLESACIKVGKRFWLLRAPQTPEQSVGITPDQVDNILSVASMHFDYVFVDLERTLDPLSLRAMDRSDYIFPIMQTVLPYVRGTQRLQRTFRALHYPDSKIRLVANRQGKSDDLPTSKIEAALQSKFYIHLPNDFQNANASINAGKPLYEIAPGGVLTRALIEWSNRIIGIHAPASGASGRSIGQRLKTLFG